MHEYAASLVWEGNQGAGTADYAGYARRFRIAIAGKPDLPGTADPLFRGEPGLHNPEELMLAALTGCHMLTYLALCARGGIVVLAYEDEATASLELTPGGGGELVEATLRPRVRVAAGSDAAAARELHARAAEQCFVARSVRFPVRHQPSIEVEPAGDVPGAAAMPAAGERRP